MIKKILNAIIGISVGVGVIMLVLVLCLVMSWFFTHF